MRRWRRGREGTHLSGRAGAEEAAGGGVSFKKLTGDTTAQPRKHNVDQERRVFSKQAPR